MRLSGFTLAMAVSAVAHAQFPPLAPAGEKAGAPGAAYLNVIATDNAGQPVTGLTAADFSLTQDGQDLSIKEFAEGTANGRSIVLVVDDLGLSVAGVDRVRQGLENLLAGLEPKDRAAIVRTSGGPAALVQLTSDGKALAEQLERVDFSPFADPAGAQLAPFLTGTMQGVRSVMASLAGASGRKAVVLLSERLNLTGRPPQQADLAMETISSRSVELAEMAEAAFYAIGLHSGNSQATSLVQIETGIAMIAAGSGGLILDGSQDLSATLARVMRDFAGSYRIGFQSTNRYQDFVTQTDIYRKLAVRTAKPGVVLRAPASVYGPAGKPAQNSLAVKVTPIITQIRATGSQLSLLIHVDGGSLVSVRDLKGRHNATLEADVTVFDANGQAGAETPHGFAAHMNSDQFAAAQRQGVVCPVLIPIRGAGLHRVSVRVTDQAGGRTGESSAVFFVPAVANGELASSSLVLHPEREDISLDREIREGASIRQYSPGVNFRYRYDLYNLTRDSQNRSAVEMRVRLLHYGHPITVIPPQPLSFDGTGDTSWRMVYGLVRTPPNFAEGHYVLAVTSVDKLAAKPREVTEYMDFWIRHE